MKADKDLPIIGRSNFPKTSLLSPAQINHAAFAVMKDMMEKCEAEEADQRIHELRKSCGVPNPPTKIRIGLAPSPYKEKP